MGTLRIALAVCAALAVAACDDSPGAPATGGGGGGSGGGGGGGTDDCPLSAACDPGALNHPVPGPGGFMLDDSNSSGGIVVDPGGALTLGDGATSSAHAAWIANSSEGTVSKLDIATAREVARYISAVGYPNRDASRTALDQNFDAYVANRAFGLQGSITKFANNERDCIDRNGNGVIDTSHDISGNGRIETANPLEYLGVADECILWTTPVGGDDALPRAIAVSLTRPGSRIGNVWTGLFNERQACELDGTSGALIQCISTSPVRAYGAATGQDGRIWFLSRGATGNVLGSITYGSPPIWTNGTTIPAGTNRDSYGLSFDASGYIWMVNDGPDGQVRSYDTRTGAWRSFELPRIHRCGRVGRSTCRLARIMGNWVWNCDDGTVSSGAACWGDGDCRAPEDCVDIVRGRCSNESGRSCLNNGDCRSGGTCRSARAGSCETCLDRIPLPRGVAADENNLWIAISHECSRAPWDGCDSSEFIAHFTISDGAATFLEYVQMPTVRGAIGAGVALDTSVWAIGQSSNSAGRYDPATRRWIENPVGSGPYTYSDFLGYGLNVLAEQRGAYHFTVDSCDWGVATWQSLEYTADIPAGTSVRFNVRAADTPGGLGAATWIGPFNGPSPLSLQLPPGPILQARYLEVEAILESMSAGVRPRVFDINVQFRCDAPAD